MTKLFLDGKNLQKPLGIILNVTIPRLPICSRYVVWFLADPQNIFYWFRLRIHHILLWLIFVWYIKSIHSCVSFIFKYTLCYMSIITCCGYIPCSFCHQISMVYPSSGAHSGGGVEMFASWKPAGGVASGWIQPFCLGRGRNITSYPLVNIQKAMESGQRNSG